MESAQVTLVKGDLRGIVRARQLSRATVRNIPMRFDSDDKREAIQPPPNTSTLRIPASNPPCARTVCP